MSDGLSEAGSSHQTRLRTFLFPALSLQPRQLHCFIIIVSFAPIIPRLDQYSLIQSTLCATPIQRLLTLPSTYFQFHSYVHLLTRTVFNIPFPLTVRIIPAYRYFPLPHLHLFPPPVRRRRRRHKSSCALCFCFCFYFGIPDADAEADCGRKRRTNRKKPETPSAKQTPKFLGTKGPREGLDQFRPPTIKSSYKPNRKKKRGNILFLFLFFSIFFFYQNKNRLGFLGLIGPPSRHFHRRSPVTTSPRLKSLAPPKLNLGLDDAPSALLTCFLLVSFLPHLLSITDPPRAQNSLARLSRSSSPLASSLLSPSASSVLASLGASCKPPTSPGQVVIPRSTRACRIAAFFYDDS